MKENYIMAWVVCVWDGLIIIELIILLLRVKFNYTCTCNFLQKMKKLIRKSIAHHYEKTGKTMFV
jgi:hypothetical protein